MLRQGLSFLRKRLILLYFMFSLVGPPALPLQNLLHIVCLHSFGDTEAYSPASMLLYACYLAVAPRYFGGFGP